eukprot:TRINITY_DN1245_c3_g1_i1.p1 TRINITY_DN1245_c3_g1~~TRINITY_DN1245_c3_g1_i1.p1  ORF type:complete len:1124 (+),score=197.74 TRINITY_DN1245_c3_g1_i1:217-3588(+)
MEAMDVGLEESEQGASNHGMEEMEIVDVGLDVPPEGGALPQEARQGTSLETSLEADTTMEHAVSDHTTAALEEAQPPQEAPSTAETAFVDEARPSREANSTVEGVSVHNEAFVHRHASEHDVEPIQEEPSVQEAASAYEPVSIQEAAPVEEVGLAQEVPYSHERASELATLQESTLDHEAASLQHPGEALPLQGGALQEEENDVHEAPVPSAIEPSQHDSVQITAQETYNVPAVETSLPQEYTNNFNDTVAAQQSFPDNFASNLPLQAVEAGPTSIEAGPTSTIPDSIGEEGAVAGPTSAVPDSNGAQAGVFASLATRAQPDSNYGEGVLTTAALDTRPAELLPNEQEKHMVDIDREACLNFMRTLRPLYDPNDPILRDAGKAVSDIDDKVVFAKLLEHWLRLTKRDDGTELSETEVDTLFGALRRQKEFSNGFDAFRDDAFKDVLQLLAQKKAWLSGRGLEGMSTATVVSKGREGPQDATKVFVQKIIDSGVVFRPDAVSLNYRTMVVLGPRCGWKRAEDHYNACFSQFQVISGILPLKDANFDTACVVYTPTKMIPSTQKLEGEGRGRRPFIPDPGAPAQIEGSKYFSCTCDVDRRLCPVEVIKELRWRRPKGAPDSLYLNVRYSGVRKQGNKLAPTNDFKAERMGVNKVASLALNICAEANLQQLAEAEYPMNPTKFFRLLRAGTVTDEDRTDGRFLIDLEMLAKQATANNKSAAAANAGAAGQALPGGTEELTSPIGAARKELALPRPEHMDTWPWSQYLQQQHQQAPLTPQQQQQYYLQYHQQLQQQQIVPGLMYGGLGEDSDTATLRQNLQTLSSPSGQAVPPLYHLPGSEALFNPPDHLAAGYQTGIPSPSTSGLPPGTLPHTPGQGHDPAQLLSGQPLSANGMPPSGDPSTQLPDYRAHDLSSSDALTPTPVSLPESGTPDQIHDPASHSMSHLLGLQDSQNPNIPAVTSLLSQIPYQVMQPGALPSSSQGHKSIRELKRKSSAAALDSLPCCTIGTDIYAGPAVEVKRGKARTAASTAAMALGEAGTAAAAAARAASVATDAAEAASRAHAAAAAASVSAASAGEALVESAVQQKEECAGCAELEAVKAELERVKAALARLETRKEETERRLMW